MFFLPCPYSDSPFTIAIYLPWQGYVYEDQHSAGYPITESHTGEANVHIRDSRVMHHTDAVSNIAYRHMGSNILIFLLALVAPHIHIHPQWLAMTSGICQNDVICRIQRSGIPHIFATFDRCRAISSIFFSAGPFGERLSQPDLLGNDSRLCFLSAGVDIS